MQGKILALVAGGGILAILAALIMTLRSPMPQRPADSHDDVVYKYCTEIFRVNEAELTEMRRNALYDGATKLKPGAYALAHGGALYVIGGGMFEILLPPQLRLARNFGDVKTIGESKRPRSIIGCTPEHLAKALKVYGIPLPAGQPSQPAGQ